MKTYLLLPILLVLLFASCSRTANNNETDNSLSVNKASDEQSTTSEEEYKLVPAPVSTKYDDAKLESMTYKNGRFVFKYSGTDFKLGEQTPDASQMMCANSAQGQHIHLIIDDQPYTAHYTPEFDYTIPDGDHIILAFLSRSYHESIKNGKAYIAQRVTVKNGSFVKAEDIKEPMLFYSRPKGNYVGEQETNKVLLDFFVINAELGDGKYSVAVDVNHQLTNYLKEWRPYYIENLPMGKNIIKLIFMDARDEPVNSPYNPIIRSFNLSKDPTEGK
ncbi:MAG: hypothetical protein KDC85_02320 [Saprospiraceae bacterium]|nr:hypothetical protein [Saprospiraceae bacterium]MCB9323781.1 phosphopeptide-binding protein [Lewinellaceae bacterium]